MPFLISRISQIYTERQARLEALQNDSQQISSLPSSSSSLNAHTVDNSRNKSHSVKKMNIISRVQKIYADRQARLNALQIQSRQPDTVSEPSPSIPNQELTTIESSRTSTGSTIVSDEGPGTRTNSDFEPFSIIRNTEPTRVIVSETSPETEFEPANKHHHFGILHYIVNNRFRKIMLTPAWLPSIWPLYLVYSFNAVVTKSGTVTLPPFNSQLFGDYYICMTLQDHGPLDTFRMVNLAWYNEKSSTSDSFEENVTSHAHYGDTTYIRKGPYPLDAVPYHMTLGFEYSEDKSNILQIRIYSVKSVDVWVPYDGYSAIDYWVAPAN
ncbi:hypothetical protein GCK72_021683 [Caenorhabditis remanei]|uniref:DUF7154 domain-containing protein n=1 Tax=Caenorhabditis remanei TaxID=31234 RepID=A0A6A5GK74_CAERE|nr:hypothetical protein GCK72_021683 [Caenorhabditis remanei]KAF1755114.1 hypothetical protein GCK72_021683 [Caenorhabditis remanei]